MKNNQTILDEQRAILNRLLLARGGCSSATRLAFNNLIRVVRTRIKRLEKRDGCK